MRKKKNRGNRYPPFVMLLWRTIDSPEWQDLSPVAQKIYIRLKRQYNGQNNGKIRLPYSALRGERGLASSATISKGFAELEQKGWIEKTKSGGLFKEYSEYRLTGKYDLTVK